MGSNQHSAVTIVSAIFRHRLLLFVLLFGTILLTVLYTLHEQKQYASSMKILVQNARQVEALSSAKNAPSLDVEGNDRDARVNSEIELLSDQDLLEHLVLYREQLLATGDAPKPGSKQMALAIRRLGGRLDVQPVKKSSVITLTYMDQTPELAQQVLRELQRTYLESHIALVRPAGSSKFFDNEASNYQEQLTNAEKELTDFRTRNSFVDIEKEKSALDDSLHALQVTTLADEAQLRSVTNQVVELSQRKQAQQNRITTSITTTPNQQGIQTLIATLTELRNTRIQLLTRYKPGDRLVVEVDDQIKNSEEALTEMRTRNAIQSSTDNNPTWMALEQQLENLQVQRAGIVESLRVHKLQEANYQSRLNTLLSITPTSHELERRVDEMKGMNQSISDKRDASRVEDLLDAAQFGNVRVAQQPTYSQLHVKPSLFFNTLMGGITGLFLCFAALLVLEATRNTILSPGDLDAFPIAPVIATLPDFVSIRDTLALEDGVRFAALRQAN